MRYGLPAAATQAGACATEGTSPPRQEGVVFRIGPIDHVALTVSDVQRSVAWFRDVLGLARRYEEAWGDYPAVVCSGDTCVALFPASTGNPGPPPDRGNTITMRHLAFRVTRADFQAAQAELRQRNIAFSFEDHGISHSIYLHDPDGHEIELTTYDL